MSEELEKLARKRSNDPAQESLRQAKDSWNQEVKLLIAGLIAFKRGMNGRGDPKTGMPPSSIKDPLPPQVGQYLNGIATHYSKIVDDAKKIIDAQAYYSAHRRKSKPKQPGTQTPPAPTTASIIEPSLIVQGSWWGSRAWAYFALLKKIDKHNRRLRLNMLSSGLEINKGLKNFEFKIVERDPNSAAGALTILSAVSSGYLAVFLRMYDKLKDIYDVKEQTEKKAPEEAKKPDLKDRKLSLEERKVSLQEKKIQEQEEKQKQKGQVPAEPALETPVVNPEGSTVSADLWAEFQKIYSQVVKIEVVLKYIFSLENVDKSNFKTMKRALDKFQRDVNVLNDLSGRSDHDKSAVELEKLTQDIITQYKYLLQTSSAILGPAQSFDELVTRIPKPTVSAYLEIIEGQEIIRKQAASAVSNWLNKMWMSINPDNISRMKLEMVDTVGSLRQAMDVLMDNLEDREAGIDVLSAKVNEVSKRLVDLLDQGISLAKNYMIAARRQEKGKNYYLADIRQSDIKMLTDLRNDISSYVTSD